VPQLGPKWVTIGEADGGAAALTVAELESSMGASGFLGSIAISGDLSDSIKRLSEENWNDRFAFLAFGIKTVYPPFKLEDVFTAPGLARYQLANQSCSTPALEKPPALREMLKPNWQSNPLVQRFLDRNTLARKPARVPLLIVNTGDAKGPDSTAPQVVARMCGQKDLVDFETYPGQDPTSLMGVSISTPDFVDQSQIRRRQRPEHLSLTPHYQIVNSEFSGFPSDLAPEACFLCPPEPAQRQNK
jgi:hypothetical protein